jgi:hypothetical protein
MPIMIGAVKALAEAFFTHIKGWRLHILWIVRIREFAWIMRIKASAS